MFACASMIACVCHWLPSRALAHLFPRYLDLYDDGPCRLILLIPLVLGLNEVGSGVVDCDGQQRRPLPSLAQHTIDVPASSPRATLNVRPIPLPS